MRGGRGGRGGRASSPQRAMLHGKARGVASQRAMGSPAPPPTSLDERLASRDDRILEAVVVAPRVLGINQAAGSEEERGGRIQWREDNGQEEDEMRGVTRGQACRVLA